MSSAVTLDTVKEGDVFLSEWHIMEPNRRWFYISTVISMEPISTRFGVPDRILEVEVATNEGRVIDKSKKIWFSQVVKGLV